MLLLHLFSHLFPIPILLLCSYITLSYIFHSFIFHLILFDLTLSHLISDYRSLLLYLICFYRHYV